MMAKRPATAGKRYPVSAVARLEEIARIADIDRPRATILAERAKKDGLVGPLIHHLIAQRLKREGRFEEAIAEAGLGLELKPQHAGLMITVGFCLMDLDRRKEAAQVFGVAVKLDPASADASYGYGWAAEGIGALESAESGFKRAAALNPNYADAHAGLSGLAVRRRDWATARSYAERAAALDGRQTDALMNLARVDIGEGNYESAERRLREIIPLPHLNSLARADARIMLGDALDGAQRYREAFDAYAEGKADVRAQYRHVHERPGAATVMDAVGGILAEFLDTPPSSWERPAFEARGDEKGQAFLLGFSRSGTTLLEQILSSHPEIEALGERPILIDAEAEFLTRAGGVRRLAAVLGDLLEPYRRSYWKRVREFGVDPSGKMFIDKHPLSTMRLPLIAKVFPFAKIIFVMRDPRDVVLSCFRRNFNMNPSNYQFTTIETAARYYDSVMRAGDVYMDRLPIDLLRLRYEDLVADFEATGRALCGFLGVEWTESLRDFADSAAARRIATPSSTQVGRGLYHEGVDQWRHYAFALEPVMPILQPWIEKFGYAAR